MSEDANREFLMAQARRHSVKEGAKLAKISEKTFEAVRLGRQKVSFDTLTTWARNDLPFALALSVYLGVIDPKDAAKADAISRAIKAYSEEGG